MTETRPIAAIVGAAYAPSQDAGCFTPAGLMAEASANAIFDAGIDKAEIDALYSASSYYYMPTLTLGEYLGIRPTTTDSTTIGGCSFVAHIRHASFAFAAGESEYALVAHASTQRSDGKRHVYSASEHSAYEIPYGPLWPISGYAMIAQRHMYEFGTTSEQLAEVAVAARQWANRNPDVPRKEALTVDDVLSSPLIADPLHRLDCCLVSDGAAAIVVTSPERARERHSSPVFVLGAAETHKARNISQLGDFVSSPALDTAPRALRQAGLSLMDIDAFQLYDAFTISVLQLLEDVGLCAKGESGAFVEDGRLRPGGELAINTNGGGLSCRHPGMLGMPLLLEAVVQLRNEGGSRQVPNAQHVLVHGLGGVQMSGATAVLAGSQWDW